MRRIRRLSLLLSRRTSACLSELRLTTRVFVFLPPFFVFRFAHPGRRYAVRGPAQGHEPSAPGLGFARGNHL